MARKIRTSRNILMELRKVCQHPYLVDPDMEKSAGSDKDCHRLLTDASGKLLFLKQLLPRLKERGHRVLLFSQFKIALDLIQDFLWAEGYKYLRLDGDVHQIDRQRNMDKFNAPDSDYFIFLLTTRAGGVGINLATADTVIIHDPDFNPHQDLQAIARSHRYGQQNRVLVFKLMAEKSVEGKSYAPQGAGECATRSADGPERIIQTGKKKLVLDHLVVQQMNEDVEEGEIGNLILYGAEEITKADETSSGQIWTPQAIDQLIDSAEQKAEAEAKRLETAEQDDSDDNKREGRGFAFAQVWETKGAELKQVDVGAPDEPVFDENGWDAFVAEAERVEQEHQKALASGAVPKSRLRGRKPVNYRLDEPDRESKKKRKRRSPSEIQDKDTDFVVLPSDDDSDVVDDGLVADDLMRELAAQPSVSSDMAPAPPPVVNNRAKQSESDPAPAISQTAPTHSAARAQATPVSSSVVDRETLIRSMMIGPHTSIPSVTTAISLSAGAASTSQIRSAHQSVPLYARSGASHASVPPHAGAATDVLNRPQPPRAGAPQPLPPLQHPLPPQHPPSSQYALPPQQPLQRWAGDLQQPKAAFLQQLPHLSPGRALPAMPTYNFPRQPLQMQYVNEGWTTLMTLLRLFDEPYFSQHTESLRRYWHQAADVRLGEPPQNRKHYYDSLAVAGDRYLATQKRQALYTTTDVRFRVGYFIDSGLVASTPPSSRQPQPPSPPTAARLVPISSPEASRIRQGLPSTSTEGALDPQSPFPAPAPSPVQPPFLVPAPPLVPAAQFPSDSDSRPPIVQPQPQVLVQDSQPSRPESPTVAPSPTSAPQHSVARPRPSSSEAHILQTAPAELDSDDDSVVPMTVETEPTVPDSIDGASVASSAQLHPTPPRPNGIQTISLSGRPRHSGARADAGVNALQLGNSSRFQPVVAQVSGQGDSDKEDLGLCVWCGGQHALHDCPALESVETLLGYRQSILKSSEPQEEKTKGLNAVELLLAAHRRRSAIAKAAARRKAPEDGSNDDENDGPMARKRQRTTGHERQYRPFLGCTICHSEDAHNAAECPTIKAGPTSIRAALNRFTPNEPLHRVLTALLRSVEKGHASRIACAFCGSICGDPMRQCVEKRGSRKALKHKIRGLEAERGSYENALEGYRRNWRLNNTGTSAGREAIQQLDRMINKVDGELKRVLSLLDPLYNVYVAWPNPAAQPQSNGDGNGTHVRMPVPVGNMVAGGDRGGQRSRE